MTGGDGGKVVLNAASDAAPPALSVSKSAHVSSTSLRTREPFTSSNEENGMEMTSLPRPEDAPVHVRKGSIQTIWQERIAVMALWWCLFMAGWNDASTGPLLPRIQLFYNVNYTVVSTIFIANFVGFMTAAVLNVTLTDRFGFGIVIAIGATFQVVAYAIQAPAPPFPVFVIAFVINGFGIGLQDAQSNVFVAYLPNAEAKFGWLHAFYGLGAMTSPLVATQFSQIPHWSYHYVVSLGISASNLIVLLAVFRFKTQEHLLGVSAHHVEEGVTAAGNKYQRMFALRTLHLLAFFILVYVGLEVTIGGWIVTYIIEVRGGGASSGYVSSGFFGGLTVGRVALIWVNKKLGPKYSIIVYCLLSIALELIIWLVRSLISDAVAVSLVGLLIGPIYPIVMNVASRILPTALLAGSIGWIASFGQAGSAVFPFVTGALAQKEGVQVLEPLLVAMLALLIAMWAMVPTKPATVD